MKEPSKSQRPAYPVALQLKAEALAISGQIVKLTPQGFLAEISSTTIQTGEKFEAHFNLENEAINEPVVIIKIYSQWTASAATPAPSAVVRLIEAHFQAALSQKLRLALASFLQPEKIK